MQTITAAFKISNAKSKGTVLMRKNIEKLFYNITKRGTRMLHRHH